MANLIRADARVLRFLLGKAGGAALLDTQVPGSVTPVGENVAIGGLERIRTF